MSNTVNFFEKNKYGDKRQPLFTNGTTNERFIIAMVNKDKGRICVRDRRDSGNG